MRPLAFPGKVIADEHGNLWIADSGHHRLVGADRHGRVHTIVGAGAPGHEDGPLARARLRNPQGLALTRSGRILYLADTGNHTIRRVDLVAGTVTTVAGTGQIRRPWDLALDEEAGGLFIAMAGSHRIWRMDLQAGTLEVLAGTGAEALVDGPAHQAAFAQPSGLALSPDRRRLYVADRGSSAVRVVHLDGGQVETLAGAGPMASGDVDGPRHQARLQRCSGLTLGPAGLVVADTGNHTLRGINLRHGTVITLWRGRGSERLDQPGGVTFERIERSYVVADSNNHRLVRVARDASTAAEITLTGLAGLTGLNDLAPPR